MAYSVSSLQVQSSHPAENLVSELKKHSEERAGLSV